MSTYFDPVQAALYWFIVANGGKVAYRTKRQLAQKMNINPKTLYKLLADPERLAPIQHELSLSSLSLPRTATPSTT